MLHFRCLGIPVRVEPFFWLTLSVLGAMSVGRGMGRTPQEISAILLFVAAGFLSILVHELGHALTARRFGARVNIVLQAFGGYARYTSAGITNRQNILITAAGPAYQILLGFLAFGLIAVLPPLERLNEFRADRAFLVFVAGISWVWAVFNLLPILPMDGGRILQYGLGPTRIRTTLQISIGTCAVLGVLAAVYREPFVAVFMGFFAYQSWQALQQVRWR